MIYDEYVGKNVDYVVSELTEKAPDKNVMAVSNDMAVTADFRPDRIRVWFDGETKEVTDVIIG